MCPLRAVDVDPGRLRSLVITGHLPQVRRPINDPVHPRYANWFTYLLIPPLLALVRFRSEKNIF